jgi:NADPH2:quinone reductase
VHAAGVSFADLLVSRGQYQVRPDPPFVPGFEVAGVVDAAPDGNDLRVGQRVAAAVTFGAFAEMAVADPAMVMPIPDSLGFDAAGGFVLNYHTALFALQRRACTRPGEVVVVHGAGGGLGSAAVQVAKALEAHVIGVGSTEAKRTRAREDGADDVLDTDQDLKQSVLELTGGKGADVIFDPVGGDRFKQSLRCLAAEGRLVTVGFTSGEIPSAPANRLLLRNSGVLGAAWREFVDEQPEYFREAGAELVQMHERGAIHPSVGKRYQLDDGAEALRDLEARRALGKLVLHIQ